MIVTNLLLLRASVRQPKTHNSSDTDRKVFLVDRVVQKGISLTPARTPP